MATLKDSVVQGSLRATNSLLATTGQFKILNAPDGSNSTTYSAGNSGQVLRSNGSSAYWGALSTSDLGSGTLPIERGGTGQGTAANAANALLSGLPSWGADPTDAAQLIRGGTGGETNFGRVTFSTVWNYIKGKSDTTYVKKSGDTMTGALTVKGLKGTSGTDYGTSLPSSPAEGQMFFQISDPWYELPAGGSAGQVLMKNSNSNYDVKWGQASGGGIDTIYPIGAIFISTVNTNPGTYMSGTTWEAFGAGKILVGVNSSDTDFNTVEKTGGGKTVTIAETNLPSHTHSIPSLSGSTDNQGSHKHTFYYGRSWGVGAHDLPSASSTDVGLTYEWLPTNNMENAGG